MNAQRNREPRNEWQAHLALIEALEARNGAAPRCPYCAAVLTYNRPCRCSPRCDDRSELRNRHD